MSASAGIEKAHAEAGSGTSRNDQSVTMNHRQKVFISWTLAVLLNIVVLGLFEEHFDGIVIDSFTILIFTALVLKALLEVTLAIEHHVHDFFAGRAGRFSRALGYATMFAILFSSKFAILEIINLIFRDHVELHGFIPLVSLIITMILAERAVTWIYARLADSTSRGTPI